MPAQQNVTSLDAGQMRFEPLHLGDSQVQPELHYRQPEFLAPVEDSHFEPAVTVLSMTLHWERLLAHEKRRNRQLTFMVGSLQDQLLQADMGYKVLRQQYESLLNDANGNSQPRWSPHDAQKTPTVSNGLQFPNPPVSPANKSPGAMPPPPTPKEETTQGTKRLGVDITGGTTKRAATRNLVLNPYDRPLSPKSIFSPQTPTSMNF